jgi:acyl-CoA thioester hydrolase
VTLLIRHRLPVRFRDCDGLGHVNNAVYLTYLEQARFALWRAQIGFTGRPENAPGPRGVGFIMARAEVDFRAQARYGDELEVRLSLAAIGRTSFTYLYDVVRLPAEEPSEKSAEKPTEKIVAAAKTVQVWFDYDAERPVPISEEFRARLARPI